MDMAGVVRARIIDISGFVKFNAKRYAKNKCWYMDATAVIY